MAPADQVVGFAIAIYSNHDIQEDCSTWLMKQRTTFLSLFIPGLPLPQENASDSKSI